MRIGVHIGPFWISGRVGGRKRRVPRSRAASGPSAREIAAKRKKDQFRAPISEALAAGDVETAAKLAQKARRKGLYPVFTDYGGRGPLTVNFWDDPARPLPPGWQWVGSGV